MRTKDQILLEQAYNKVADQVPSIFDEQGIAFGRDLENYYSAYIIMPDDTELLLKAISKSGLKREGVKIIRRVDYEHLVYVIIPKSLHVREDPHKVYRRIIEVVKTPKIFSLSDIPKKEKFKIVTDPYDDMTDELPELEGIFNS